VDFLNIKLRLIAALWQAPATYLGRYSKRPYLRRCRQAPVHITFV